MLKSSGNEIEDLTAFSQTHRFLSDLYGPAAGDGTSNSRGRRSTCWARRALRGLAGYKWRKIHKPTTLSGPSLPLSTPVHATSHLPRTATPTEGRICPENQGEKHEEKMASSDTRRSAAMKLLFYSVPRAIRRCPRRW